DGIRDLIVTGVQTCALPISPSALNLVPPRNLRNLLYAVRELGRFVVVIGVIVTLVGLVMWSDFAPKWLGRLPGDIRIEREHSARSEERRVGKECGWRWGGGR